MTPQEKANELVNKYFLEIEGADTYAFNLPSTNLYIAKQCALVAVDEIIRIAPWGGDIDNEIEDDSKEYYMKVKQEIEKL